MSTASVTRWCAEPFLIREDSDGMSLMHQLLLSRHVLSKGADATSTVSRGKAIASSNGFVVATDFDCSARHRP
jgi:hypothetical protein